MATEMRNEAMSAFAYCICYLPTSMLAAYHLFSIVGEIQQNSEAEKSCAKESDRKMAQLWALLDIEWKEILGVEAGKKKKKQWGRLQTQQAFILEVYVQHNKSRKKLIH